MFRRYAWDPYEKTEMTLEDILIYFAKLSNKPEYVSDDTWELIISETPHSEDTLEQIESGLRDDINDDSGATVLMLEWSGEGMAHSGFIFVSTWGPFYIFTSSDYDNQGPFHTIEDVLELEYFSLNSIPGGVLKFNEPIISRTAAFNIAYNMCGEDGETIVINDVTYVRKEGKLIIGT